jgi:hypothetical protein
MVTTRNTNPNANAQRFKDLAPQFLWSLSKGIGFAVKANLAAKRLSEQMANIAQAAHEDERINTIIEENTKVSSSSTESKKKIG